MTQKKLGIVLLLIGFSQPLVFLLIDVGIITPPTFALVILFGFIGGLVMMLGLGTYRGTVDFSDDTLPQYRRQIYLTLFTIIGFGLLAAFL